jgi:hypothetical protein
MKSMMPGSPLRTTLVIALAVHAGVLAWMAFARKPAPSSVSRPALELGFDELELQPLTASLASPPARTEERGPPEPAPASDRNGAPISPALSRASRGAPGASAGTGEVVTAPDATTDEAHGWSFSPTKPEGTAASAERLAAATRAGVRVAVAETEKKRATRAPVLPRFLPRDMELGLAPGGPLATLARDHVRRSLVPDVSKALLELRTDGAGIVASIRVLEVSSGRREWDEVATGLLAPAREKPLRVPEGTAGLTITIEVTSSLKTVSGANPSGNALTKLVGAVTNPLDTIVDSKTPPQRIVAARVVAVDTL